MNPRSLRIGILLSVSVVGAAIVLHYPPFGQDPAYHNFVDVRRMFGIPNFLNVVSNIPFLLSGSWGLILYRRDALIPKSAPLLRISLTLFIAIILTGLGSAYYHLAPSTVSLLWDRLPLAVAFMALFALIIGDGVSERGGDRLLLPLMAAGIGSVFYWYATEIDGQGDLRPYVIVQFLPILVVPLILILFKSVHLRSGMLWATLGVYGLAKLAEHFDVGIYRVLAGTVSGHTLKHLLAGLASLFVVRSLRVRPDADRAGR